MIKRVNIRSVWSLVFSLAMLATTAAQAAAVIYEPFAQTSGSISGKAASTTGLTGTWTLGAGTVNVVTPDTITHGALANANGQVDIPNASTVHARVTTSSALADAGLLADGAELWFSLVFQKTSTSGSANEWSGFAFGTSYVIGASGAVNMNASGNGIGFITKGGALDVTTWTGGTNTRTTSHTVNNSTPTVIVGKINWGATSGDVETITLYKASPGLSSLGTGVSRTMAGINQSAFNTISFTQRDSGGTHTYDEIRFGATQADVLPADTAAPVLASITDNKGGGPIYEDVAEVTYSLTFDEHMDLTTITVADFDNVGTATATVGTVSQPSLNVIQVKLLPTTDGTLQLRIPAGSVLKSLAGVDLDTTIDRLDDTTITINSGTTPVAGTLYWDGTRTSGMTDGTSQGGTATWNTTTTCWDLGAGLDGPFAWNNSSSLSAVFGGTAGTVTLGTDITLQGLTIGTASGYFIGNTTEDNTLTFSGTKTITVNSVDATIRAGIAGSPTLNISGLTFFSLLPPANVTMTLGTLNMINTPASDKSLILGGESTNVVDAVTWSITNNQLYLTKAGAGSWTINNNLAFNTGGSRASRLYVQQGTLTLLGSSHFLTHKIGVATLAGSQHTASGNDSKLIAKGTITINDNREWFYVQNKGVLSPGPGVGTLTVTWNANSSSSAANGAFNMQTGSIYEWDIASKTSTDVINVTTGGSNNGNLILGNMKIKIRDAGVTSAIVPTDPLPVFTYETGAQAVVRSIGTITIDTSALTGGWSGTPSLVDNGTGTIYLTGLQSPVSGTVIQLK